MIQIRTDLIKKFKVYSNLLEQVLPKEDFPGEFFKKIFDTKSKEKDFQPVNVKTEATEQIVIPKKLTPSKGRARKLLKNESRINKLNLDAW